MQSKEFQDKMQSMLDTIGNDNANLILDDVGLLMTDNEKMNADLQAKDNEIEKLKKLNATLQKVNGNLLMQVSVAEEQPSRSDEVEKQKPAVDLRTCFDKNGRFIK